RLHATSCRNRARIYRDFLQITNGGRRLLICGLSVRFRAGSPLAHSTQPRHYGRVLYLVGVPVQREATIRVPIPVDDDWWVGCIAVAGAVVAVWRSEVTVFVIDALGRVRTAVFAVLIED